MNYLGDIRLGATLDVKFCTTAAATGAPTTLAGTPVISAYVGNSTTEITAGITLTVDFDGRTGLHNIRVVASGGNGFATASNYQLVITTGTVGGTSAVGYVVGQFSIEARSNLMPTTADRTLDVTATGTAGVDWANVEGQSTSVNLSATTTNVVNTATATTTVNGLAANVITAAATAADFGTEVAGAVWNEDATGHQTQGSFGQVLGDSGADTDSVWALANTNLDAAVSSRMAAYAQPAGFLAATFPATVASTTNITAGTMTTTTNLTNLPSIPANWLTAAGIAAAALNGKGDWNIGKTGYILTQAFPANFSALSITAGGLVDIVAASVRAAVGLAAANLDTQLDAVPTAVENAAEVLAVLNATTIPVDAQKMNNAEIIGDGTIGNRWRGVGVPP